MRYVKMGRNRVSITSIMWYAGVPLTIVAVLLSLRIFASTYLSDNWAWVVGVGVFGLLMYMLIGYVRRQGTRKIFEKYRTDMTVIGFSLFGIIVLNYLMYYLTTAEPKIWQWYWGNKKFFWSWNTGWVIIALLSSKRDGEGKIIPIAATIRICVGLVMFLGFGVNLFYYKLNPTKTTDTLFAKEPVLAVVAKCRPREFDSLEKVEKAEKLYQEQGLMPWQDSMSCWESMIPRDILPIRLAVVEAPTEGWSKAVKIPKIRNTFSDWPDAPEGCEVRLDGDEERKLPCKKADFTETGNLLQFHSTGPKPEKVEVVVRQ